MAEHKKLKHLQLAIIKKEICLNPKGNVLLSFCDTLHF